MATSMLPIQPAGVRACATTNAHRKTETTKGKWCPVFGWSTEPDYIHSPDNNNNNKNLDWDPISRSGSDPIVAVKPRFAPGAFTEEKARRLRMMTNETTAFHDAMYHSSIAAKLASDFPKS